MSLEVFVYLAIVTTASSRAEPLSGNVLPPKPKEFPFIVSIAKILGVTDDNPLGHVCGGALIALRYVVTAASCFEVGSNKKNYFVYAGSTDLTQSTVVMIKDIIKFDDWFAKQVECRVPFLDRNYKTNDIAVVKLEQRMPAYSKKASVWNISPELLMLALAAHKRTIQTAGWAKSPNGTPPKYMLKSDLQLVNRDECLSQIQNESNNMFYTHDVNIFCTKGNESFTVLDAGDKGSPIFVKYGRPKYLIVGINLKSVPETNNETRYPNLRNTHISVNAYIRFLRSVAKITD